MTRFVPLGWAQSVLVLGALVICGLDLTALQTSHDALASKILTLESQWNTAYRRGDLAVMNSLLSCWFHHYR